MQELTKLKVTTNPKLTCTQITQSLKKFGWKKEWFMFQKWKNETQNQNEIKSLQTSLSS
jgi:hypothetical protein